MSAAQDVVTQPHSGVVGHARSAIESPLVLVVDDELLIREVIEDLLADEGYRVVLAANGREALAVLDAQMPAVILLDMRMPVLDGWGFMRVYRERSERRAPVLVMTAARDARSWSEEVGGDAYLAKPFEIASLLALVARLTA